MSDIQYYQEGKSEPWQNYGYINKFIRDADNISRIISDNPDEKIVKIIKELDLNMIDHGDDTTLFYTEITGGIIPMIIEAGSGVLVNKSYSSCTSIIDKAIEFVSTDKCCILMFTIPSHLKYHKISEQEVLVERNTQFIIDNKSSKYPVYNAILTRWEPPSIIDNTSSRKDISEALASNYKQLGTNSLTTSDQSRSIVLTITEMISQIKTYIKECYESPCMHNGTAQYDGSVFVYTIASMEQNIDYLLKTTHRGEWSKDLEIETPTWSSYIRDKIMGYFRPNTENSIKGILLFKNLELREGLKGKGILTTVFDAVERLCDEYGFIIVISSFHNFGLAKYFAIKREYDLYNKTTKITDLQELDNYIQFMATKPSVVQLMTTKFDMNKLPQYAVRLSRNSRL